MPSRTRCFPEINTLNTSSGDLPTPIHTMADTRERWQLQTCEGTAEAKDILEFVAWGLVYLIFTFLGFVSWWAHPLKSIAVCCSSDLAKSTFPFCDPLNAIRITCMSMDAALFTIARITYQWLSHWRKWMCLPRNHFLPSFRHLKVGPHGPFPHLWWTVDGPSLLQFLYK